MERGIAPMRLLKEIFSDSSPLVRLFAVIVLMGSGYIVITSLGLLLVMPLFSLTWEQLQEILSEGMQETNIGFLYYIQGLQSISLFIVPALLAYAIVLTDEAKRVFGIRERILPAAFLIFITLVFSFPILESIIRWNASIRLPEVMNEIEATLQNLEEERIRITERLLKSRDIYWFIMAIIVVSILPALGEEFFFRGVLQKIFTDWFKNPHLGIIVASACFSAFHLQFYGFVPRLILGIYFGYLFVWSRSIWIPVLAHFLNNTIAVCISFFTENSNGGVITFFTGQNGFSIASVAISIVLTIFLIILTRKMIIIPKIYQK